MRVALRGPRLMTDIGSYYLLGYVSTNTKLDGRYRRLTVRVMRPGVTVRARPGYLAPSASEVAAAGGAAGGGKTMTTTKTTTKTTTTTLLGPFHRINHRYPGLRLLHRDPDIYEVEDFLSHDQCDRIVAKAIPRLAPCVVASEVVAAPAGGGQR